MRGLTGEASGDARRGLRQAKWQGAEKPPLSRALGAVVARIAAPRRADGPHRSAPRGAMRVAVLVIAACVAPAASAWPSWLRLPRREQRDRKVSRVLEHFKNGEYYGALGAKPKDTPQQLKKAYRAMAMAVHPDKVADSRAASAFDALRDAYDVLSEPMARAQYDQQRAYRLQQEKLAKHERRADRTEKVGGVAGQVWRHKFYVGLAWVLVKTLLA